jgi:hypothetical protein
VEDVRALVAKARADAARVDAMAAGRGGGAAAESSSSVAAAIASLRDDLREELRGVVACAVEDVRARSAATAPNGGAGDVPESVREELAQIKALLYASPLTSPAKPTTTMTSPRGGGSNRRDANRRGVEDVGANARWEDDDEDDEEEDRVKSPAVASPGKHSKRYSRADEEDDDDDDVIVPPPEVATRASLGTYGSATEGRGGKRGATETTSAAAAAGASPSRKPSSTADASEPPRDDPPHPPSYVKILEMLEKGETPPGIKDVDDKPPNPNAKLPKSRKRVKKKPWERDGGKTSRAREAVSRATAAAAGTTASSTDYSDGAGFGYGASAAKGRGVGGAAAEEGEVGGVGGGGGGWQPPRVPAMSEEASKVLMGRLGGSDDGSSGAWSVGSDAYPDGRE